MVFTKKLVSSSWAAVGVMLSVCMTGCTSTESIGSFWLGEDGFGPYLKNMRSERGIN